MPRLEEARYLPIVERPHALAATLGTEPQVVLLAFTRLVQQGWPVAKCLVFHTRSPQPGIRAALARLQELWPSWSRGATLECAALPLEDLDSQEALVRAYRVLRQGIQGLKEAGFIVHLCVSGGRKPLALAAFLTAQFLFGPQDRLWYLYSPPEEENRDPLQLLRDPRVRLVELPVPIWTYLPAFLQAVGRYHDPWTAAEVQRLLVRQTQQGQVSRLYFERLTPAERKVVQELVCGGGTNKEIARRLGKSPRTVGHQLASVYDKLRQELGQALPIDRTTVASLFAPLLRLGQTTDDLGAKGGQKWTGEVNGDE
ncbi:MAG: CRISPR-associated ring nuclease [Candidatus Bipolaricaulaceae bacterium]